MSTTTLARPTLDDVPAHVIRFLQRRGFTALDIWSAVGDDGEGAAYRPNPIRDAFNAPPEVKHITWTPLGQTLGRPLPDTPSYYQEPENDYAIPASMHYATDDLFVRVFSENGAPKLRHAGALIPRPTLYDSADAIDGLTQLDVYEISRLDVGDVAAIGPEPHTTVQRAEAPDLSAKGIRERWPNLFAHARYVANLSDGETRTAFAGLLRGHAGSEAVQHYGGPRRVIEHAARRSRRIARIVA